MAENIQVKLPVEMTPLVEEIKQVRSEKFEPKSNKAIVIDAIKNYHKKVCK